MCPTGSSCTPSGSPGLSGARSLTTQWTHVRFGAAGSGASGSSTMRARLRVVAGTPDHASGGERSLPSCVYLRGISSPSANALEVILMVTPVCNRNALDARLLRVLHVQIDVQRVA